tara:strand:+ start:818 stop:1060 length:243 start_codon:yes stop_codon:yes gene_type:complete
MELDVYWLEFAENKLEDIFGYYSIKASKKTALKIVDGIINKTFGIEKQPKIGAIESSLKHRKEEFRYLRIIKSFIGLTPN